MGEAKQALGAADLGSDSPEDSVWLALDLGKGSPLDAPVVASVIASTTSLVVAVVGLIANGRGQRRASQQAHANALALFERQSTEQAAAREEEAEDRLALAHLDERRRLYARFAVLLDRMPELDLNRQSAFADWQAREGEEETTEYKEARQKYRDLNKQHEELHDELGSVLWQIRMMAKDPELSATAGKWLVLVAREASREEQDDAESEYLALVREELRVWG